MNGIPPLVIPLEAHEPMRRAIAPELSCFNAASDVKGFIVIALGGDSYELRTDMSPAVARGWLLRLAAEMGADAETVEEP